MSYKIRFVYYRSIAFLVLWFNRRIQIVIGIEFYTYFDTKSFSPPIAYAILALCHSILSAI
ncbi:MAG: hypothetical protein K1X73_00580 [Bacteroidia bacterium]|nr:hypothetical protein [Bacteroidia bacterium]HMY13443.1 hypothetical protein [Bacteroidia bacterium]HNB13280.1 hypothetical protein [Bacteroidia bacterium]HND72519.1 hypothetical protein [Bacteroidia bacterium]HNG84029.1 hypothetical protein [Bacteroidia bacterium]